MTTLSLFLLIGAALLFFLLFWFKNPELRNGGMVGNVLLFLFITIVAGGIFFQESIGNKVLQNIDGKIDQTTAEAFVAEKYGVTPLYSWYGFAHFQPAILIQSTDKNGIQQKITLNAFSGTLVDAHIEEVSPITYQEFTTK